LNLYLHLHHDFGCVSDLSPSVMLSGAPREQLHPRCGQARSRNTPGMRSQEMPPQGILSECVPFACSRIEKTPRHGMGYRNPLGVFRLRASDSRGGQ